MLVFWFRCVDHLQSKVTQWYALFKERIRLSVEEAIVRKYPKLHQQGQIDGIPSNGDATDREYISAQDHLSATHQLKLVISDLRDTIGYMQKDIVSLSEATNALLSGHAIYNKRITALEEIQQSSATSTTTAASVSDVEPPA